MKSDYKFLILRFTAIFVLLLFVDFSIGLIYDKISDIITLKAPNAFRTAFVMEKVNAEVLIMGASRANHHYVSSVISDSLNKTVFNSGLDGQSFSYCVAMINAVLMRYSPEIIIVDIEPRLLEASYSFGNLKELYQYYYKDDFIKHLVDKEDANQRFKMLSNMYRYNSKLFEYLKFLILPDYVQYSGYSPLPVVGYKFPVLSEKEYDIDQQIDNSKVDLLMHCINLCKDQKVNLIMSVSPRFQYSNIEEVNSFKILKDILTKNKIPFIFMGDNTLISDSSMFKDAAHLNHNGAIVFTNNILNALEKKSIIKAAN